VLDTVKTTGRSGTNPEVSTDGNKEAPGKVGEDQATTKTGNQAPSRDDGASAGGPAGDGEKSARSEE
jgi:hypothetical protein